MRPLASRRKGSADGAEGPFVGPCVLGQGRRLRIDCKRSPMRSRTTSDDNGGIRGPFAHEEPGSGPQSAGAFCASFRAMPRPSARFTTPIR